MIRIYIITILILTSCYPKKNNITQGTDPIKTNEIESPDVPFVDPINEQVKEEKNIKTKLDFLLKEGLVIADTSEQCRSRRYKVEPRTKLVVHLPQGNKLIISEWEYGIKENELKLLDFIVYDCQSNKILLESHFTIASYEIVDVNPTLKIKITADLPDDSGRLQSQEFLIKEFYEEQSKLKIRSTKLFKVGTIPEVMIDSIETEFSKRPIMEPDSDYDLEDFADEMVIIDLFKCAINGDQRCIELFKSVNDKYVIDGSLAELYYDFNSLLEEI